MSSNFSKDSAYKTNNLNSTSKPRLFKQIIMLTFRKRKLVINNFKKTQTQIAKEIGTSDSTKKKLQKWFRNGQSIK